MRKFILFTVATTAVIALAVAGTAQVAAADSGATTTHFTAAYFNGQGGFFTCSGERMVKTAPKAVTKDSETCTASDVSTLVVGTVPIGVPPICPVALCFNWFSDFDGQEAVSGTFTVIDNGDGTATVYITAYYP